MKTSLALILRMVWIRARKVMTWPSFSALGLVKEFRVTARILTLKIKFLEELTILVVPPLAHVHAERSVQARDLLGPISHEIFRCNPSQLLPPLLLNLEALFVHTAPLPLLLDEVPAAPARVLLRRRGGPAGIIGAFSKLELRV
jgi:hypothetical protein